MVPQSRILFSTTIVHICTFPRKARESSTLSGEAGQDGEGDPGQVCCVEFAGFGGEVRVWGFKGVGTL